MFIQADRLSDFIFLPFFFQSQNFEMMKQEADWCLAEQRMCVYSAML